ncbi:TorF family putative porin [Thalassotalea euphylliae]|uniref:TorF family putative porin n=1 Tax=Thalassotalea euphylliae TaxID=1655234 RepID=UPI003634994A
MNKLLTLIAASSVLLAATAQAADVSTTISGVSDYRFRGISQSAGDPALQGSVDIEFENGFYSGIFASNIDFGVDGDHEVDYYIGYYTDITEDLGIDFSINRYTYPGLDYSSDYNEMITKIFYGAFNIEIAYSDDYANTDETGTYVAINYEKLIRENLGLLENVTLTLHAGHSSGDYWDEYDIGSYSDYSIGVSADVKGFNVSLAYLFNDVDSEYEVDDGEFRNDDVLMLSVSKSFELGQF